MKEVLDDVVRWQSAGQRAAIARVVGTEGSSPRDAGAAMAVSEGSEVSGSVSGGCVEGAVVGAALEILAGERDPGVISFGYSDEDAFAVGLTCGGILDVYVEKVSKETFTELAGIAADLEAGRPVAVATVVDHPDPACDGIDWVPREAREVAVRQALALARGFEGQNVAVLMRAA